MSQRVANRAWLVVIACLGIFSGCSGPSEVTVSHSFQFNPPIRITVLDFDWSAPVATLEPNHTLINYPTAASMLRTVFPTAFLASKASKYWRDPSCANSCVKRG